MKKVLFLGLASALLATSCSKSEDDKEVVKPTISILNTDLENADICGHQVDNAMNVLTNDTLTVILKFEGTSQLSQYKLSAHENSDCHDHESLGLSEDWTVNKIVDITGTSYEVVEKFHIPADAHIGNYHFSVQLVDVLGVEADTKELNVIIANP